MSHAFRVAILTGSDTIATLNCVRRILYMTAACCH